MDLPGREDNDIGTLFEIIQKELDSPSKKNESLFENRELVKEPLTGNDRVNLQIKKGLGLEEVEESSEKSDQSIVIIDITTYLSLLVTFMKPY